MLHIRKTLSAEERAAHQRWLERHAAAAKRVRPPSDAEFWAAQKRMDELRRGLHRLQPEASSGPSFAPREATKIESRLTPEEYAAREAEAQVEIAAKKNRTAQVYNKGGMQYYSDGMLDSMLQGAHRRR